MFKSMATSLLTLGLAFSLTGAPSSAEATALPGDVKIEKAKTYFYYGRPRRHFYRPYNRVYYGPRPYYYAPYRTNYYYHRPYGNYPDGGGFYIRFRVR